MTNNQSSYLKTQLRFLFKFSLTSLVIFSFSRVVLTVLYSDRISGMNDVMQIFWGGIRIDASLISQIVGIPILLLLLVSMTNFKGYFVHYAIRIWCWLFVNIFILMEAVTPSFISEYDLRPNRLFFEYLNSPAEVSGMLIKGYWGQLIMVVVILGLSTWLSYRWINEKKPQHSSFSVTNGIYVVLLIMCLVIISRSGFQHRPINPSFVAFSHDSLVNTLPLNSTYSLLFSIYQMGDEASASKFYGSIPTDEMLDIIKGQMGRALTFIDEDVPTLHTRLPSRAKKGLNLIIIVEESLGAQFVGSLGGKPLTPFIDSYRDKSWFFTHLYATGTRSARGLEAITTGFLPSPARSVLKLPKAQHNFYTIARTLGDNGYLNRFVYGGESHFDNMKGFFLGNGFHEAVDQKDYENPAFVGNWGVSDEDLFDKALELLNEEKNQPQFLLVFSSSNHTPFEFPDGKIELFDEEKATVNNAVKYADFALGQFLNKLEEGGHLENSIVMAVADHDARVMGEDLVPINRFHIPGFIIGEGVEYKVDNTLVSQIDLAPTLLSLLGIESPTPMIGRDLTQVNDSYSGRAIMQYANNQAYLTTDHLVILQPDKDPVQYDIQDSDTKKTESKPDNNIALAHAQFASWSYDQEKYRLSK